MKYVFFGTPRFAAIILNKLIDADMAPMALVCNPDRPVGRKQIITPPATKQIILDERPGSEASKITILQPEKLDDAFIEQLKALQPDFFVVAAYANLIPQRVLDLAKLGTLGTHPSLLPKYRGASPIQSALLNGELKTGTSIYAMDSKMDHGDIYIQKSLALDGNETYLALEEKLADLSAEALVEMIPAFYQENIKPQQQDESEATFTKKFITEDGFISNDDLIAAQQSDKEKARIIVNKIRALNPEPGCWTTKDSKRIKLLQATLSDGLLKLLLIQEEGGVPKRLS